MFKELDKYIKSISYQQGNVDLGIEMTINLSRRTVLNEIENNLFSISKDSRSIYIERVLYHIFRHKMYFFELEPESKDSIEEYLLKWHIQAMRTPDDLEYYEEFDNTDFYLDEVEEYRNAKAIITDRKKIKAVEERLSKEFPQIIPDEDVEQFREGMLVMQITGDYFFLQKTFDLLNELLILIDTFGIKYNEKKYPISEVLKLKPKIDDFISKNKKFEDYLHHDNKEKLLEVLHTLLDRKKGKDVAVILLALQELGIIYLGGNRSEIYRSMREEFGDIGSSSGINDYLKKEYIMRSEIDNAKRIIEN